ncbi:histidine biosynthesis trifunctional-protein [Infundibulicybe gibba]|nr:histidine biosynthesis trifunctional-protein [Infundibulicybe gibba]
MFPFLPLVGEDSQPGLIESLCRIGPVILSQSFLPSTLPIQYYILVDTEASLDQEQLISYLNGGAEKLILPLSWAKELIGVVPPDRLIILLDVESVSAVSDKVRSGVSGVMLKSSEVDLISSLAGFFAGSAIYVLPNSTAPPPKSTIQRLSDVGATLVVPISQLTLGPSSQTQINIADAFLAPAISDRPDGLYPTIVSSETGHSLGLYRNRKGVYQSRKHGLWRKGETSGSTQDVTSIRFDFPGRSTRFWICHLNRPSCFGHTGGLSALESTLRSRLISAPEGSYTRRLYDDADLLQSKIMEEADELCQAQEKEEIGFEAADLFYFALTKCIAAGVGIADIEHFLDRKAHKVTRRPGNAKPQWAPIKQKDHRSSERAALLRRPVLKSDEMIVKVKPIVDDVRKRGDKALLELTAKFDKAQLTSTVVFPPFAPETMVVDSEVQRAIDIAYENIRKFHAAQIDGSTLVVEQHQALAGCKEIVIATPPRSDGSISPEVMYAGGAQAVAALAYGTETVPKMLVQNDTDALVSIDMPAGPSEVLVMADYTANPAFVAADLLSQAEHGADSQVVLVGISLNEEKLEAIEREVDAQAKALPRVDIIRQSVSKSIIVKASSIQEAMNFSNDYAPEHLILHLENASKKVPMIDNAGSVFVGAYTPESCGDYASGTNHTLPTNGYARQFSGVNTLSFQKHITSQEITPAGLNALGPVVATLADCEGLHAHANAVRIRLRK